MDIVWIVVGIIWAFLIGYIVLWIVIGIIGAPWVPTDLGTINKMLVMADVKSYEVLYDLGSGDGRIIIEAAKRYQARSVGVELNPVMVLWASLKIASYGLIGRAKVVWSNFFSVDLRKADVITLYLLQITNERLEPKLKKELKPGTRVVSHVFTFKDWIPVKEDTESQIYLYIV